MTEALAISKSTHALGVLSRACATAPAATVQDAVRQSIAFLAGTYGSQFQPAANSVLTWTALLEEFTAEDIARAVLGYVKAPERDDRGLLLSRFPPSAPDVYARAKALLTGREAKVREARDAAALIDDLKRAGRWETTDAQRREYLSNLAGIVSKVDVNGARA